MKKYIWQTTAWHKFRWDASLLLGPLAEAKKLQGQLLGRAKILRLKDKAEILIEETLATSGIEGEKLDRESVRSSVAKRLGLASAGLPEPKKNADGVVEVLIDATLNHDIPLTEKRLQGWQAALFPTGHSGIHKITIGDWRSGPDSMQVISGPMGKAKVHYVAPPSEQVPREMKKFFTWWGSPPQGLDGLLRAAIAHFWFVTIHPFEDGNGRLARAITDMALAQDEKTTLRLYSMSSQIIKERKAYYEVLEIAQKGNGDITGWLVWFLTMFARSVESSNRQIDKAIFIGNFYAKLEHKGLNERQKKVIKKMLALYPEEFAGGLTNKKYVSMTRVSPETAKRDIKDLVEKKVLLQNEGAGRSTSYRLNYGPRQRG